VFEQLTTVKLGGRSNYTRNNEFIEYFK